MRKTAQAALLVLLEQELVAHDDVEDQVCPLLLMLTNAEAHDDFRTEAAAVNIPLHPYPLHLSLYLSLYPLYIHLCCVCVCVYLYDVDVYQGKASGVKDMGSEMLALTISTPLTILSFTSTLSFSPNQKNDTFLTPL